MKNKDIEKAVEAIESDIKNAQSKLNILLASFKGERLESTLSKWKTLSKSKIQREFRMGYASTSILVDDLLEKGLITPRKNGLLYDVVRKKK